MCNACNCQWHKNLLCCLLMLLLSTAMYEFAPQIALALSAASLVGALFLFAAFWRMKKRWSRVFGEKALPKEKLAADCLMRLAESEKKLANATNKISNLEKLAKTNIRKVGFFRFNPFRDTGGDQSFSLALLDDEDNGVVLSGLYARENTRVYAKAIQSGKAKQPLSAEEERVLKEALEK